MLQGIAGRLSHQQSKVTDCAPKQTRSWRKTRRL